jgi:hypothetical protein
MSDVLRNPEREAASGFSAFRDVSAYTVLILDDEAGFRFVDHPRRRETTSRNHKSYSTMAS